MRVLVLVLTLELWLQIMFRDGVSFRCVSFRFHMMGASSRLLFPLAGHFYVLPSSFRPNAIAETEPGLSAVGPRTAD